MRLFTGLILGVYFLCWMIYINTCAAFEITCFSGKDRIYHGWGHKLVNQDGSLLFVEDISQAIILVSADCIVLEPLTFESKRRLLA